MLAQKESYSIDWSIDLFDSLWFHIGSHLTLNDIHRLSRTCSHLYRLFTSNDFWSFLIRKEFGQQIWYRLIKNSSLSLEHHTKTCRSKFIYVELSKRKQISFSDLDLLILDTNRNYSTIADPSSLNGYVLYLDDSLQLCYAIQIETVFKNILPGKYDVIIRMKLDIPYMFGTTEFFAVAEQDQSGQIAYLRWTQDDFFSMYRCFNCEISLTDTNLWFYQTIGTVEIVGNLPCNIHVSINNQDGISAKHGVYLDYVELKLRIE